MVDAKVITAQLKAIGADNHFWCRPERRELHKILVDGEVINHLVNGRYEGGFAILCLTDRRLLLVDKKPLYLTIEDVRYDMIAEVDFNHRLIDASVNINTLNKSLKFTSFNNDGLRSLTTYLQNRVMEIRQHINVFQTSKQNQPVSSDEDGVSQLHYRVTNPYTKVPLMMRRRVSRFYS